MTADASNTGWWNFAELCRALGIKEPGYMETWKDTVERAIAEPAQPRGEQ